MKKRLSSSSLANDCLTEGGGGGGRGQGAKQEDLGQGEAEAEAGKEEIQPGD